jgi:hypothetical protein
MCRNLAVSDVADKAPQPGARWPRLLPDLAGRASNTRRERQGGVPLFL